jgi:hypothetical protein
MVDECRAVGGMISRGNRCIRRKPAKVLLCSPQIPQYLTRARTRSSAMGTNHLSYSTTSIAVCPLPAASWQSCRTTRYPFRRLRHRWEIKIGRRCEEFASLQARDNGELLSTHGNESSGPIKCSKFTSFSKRIQLHLISLLLDVISTGHSGPSEPRSPAHPQSQHLPVR